MIFLGAENTEISTGRHLESLHQLDTRRATILRNPGSQENVVEDGRKPEMEEYQHRRSQKKLQE